MKTLIMVFVIFGSTMALACDPAPQSDWFLPLKAIIAKTDQVFVGQVTSVLDVCTQSIPVDPHHQPKVGEGTGLCYVYSMKVLKAIKGTYKAGDIVQVRARLKGRSAGQGLFNPDCQLTVGFNVSETYLIMLNAFHPDANRRVASPDDPWVKEISALTAKH